MPAERFLFEDMVMNDAVSNEVGKTETPKKKRVSKRDPASVNGATTIKKKTPRKKSKNEAASSKLEKKDARKKRIPRPYPVVPFKEATVLGDAVFQYAAGEKVRRLTLLKKLDRSPTAGATKMLITNSGKYGITNGSYVAEYFELTDEGRVACNPNADQRTKRASQFKLAIERILRVRSGHCAG